MIRLAVVFLLLACMLPAQAIGFGNLFGPLMGRSGGIDHGDADIDEALLKITAQINRKTPMSVDVGTRLDRVSAEPGKHLTYHYTLLDVRSDQVRPNDFQDKVTGPLKSRLCSAADMRGFLSNGVSISYVYQGSDGKPIGGVRFPPDSCDASARNQ